MYIKACGLLVLLWNVSSLEVEPYCIQRIDGKILFIKFLLHYKVQNSK